jgi:phosphoglycerate kinase
VDDKRNEFILAISRSSEFIKTIISISDCPDPKDNKFLELADSVFIGGKLVAEAFETDIAKNPKVFFPHGDIKALDVDTETIDQIKEKADQAKFILWNGPVGKYEDGYDAGTKEIAKILSDLNYSGKAEVIVGGGDTEDAITELGIGDRFTWVSSGGGAMLDFLANGTLPGIIALEQP